MRAACTLRACVRVGWAEIDVMGLQRCDNFIVSLPCPQGMRLRSFTAEKAQQKYCLLRRDCCSLSLRCCPRPLTCEKECVDATTQRQTKEK